MIFRTAKKFFLENLFSIISSFALVTALLWTSYSIEHNFLTQHCHFFDPLAYDVHNIQASENALRSGRWQEVWFELGHNAKYPLRTIPLLIICPELLAKPWGHVLTEAPCILSFAFLLSFYVDWKLHSKIAGLAACLIFVTLPGSIDPHLGLGANWLDMPAASSMGAGLLCLLFLAETRKPGWGWGVGSFFTITACVRWCAAFYYMTAVGPIILITLFLNRKDSKFLQQSCLNILLSAALGLVFTGLYAKDNFVYYHIYSYSLYSNILSCWYSMCLALKSFMGVVPLLSPASLATAFGIWRWRRLGATQMFNWLASLYFPCATAMFICVGVRISDAIHPMLYMVPALIVATSALIPKIKTNETTTNKHIILMSAITIAVTLGTWIVNYKKTVKALQVVSLLERKQKRLDEVQADLLGQNHLKTYAQFDDERMMCGIETFRKYGFLPEFPSACFSIHEAYWKGFYHSLNTEQISRAVYEQCCKSVDLVTIHSNESDVDRNKILDNPISVGVSKYMTRHVPADDNWRKLKMVEGPYGQMSIYRNQRL
jgi:hypothetical protein